MEVENDLLSLGAPSYFLGYTASYLMCVVCAPASSESTLLFSKYTFQEFLRSFCHDPCDNFGSYAEERDPSLSDFVFRGPFLFPERELHRSLPLVQPCRCFVAFLRLRCS